MAPTAVAERSPNAGCEPPKTVHQLRARVHENFGQIVLTLLDVPRYRHQSLADLTWLVLGPLVRDRFAVAHQGDREAGAEKDMAGFAIWASANEEVDGKIQEQTRAGVFPVRLKPEDWQSGPIPWLLDVIAPDAKTTGQVHASFRQVVPDGALRMHPQSVGLLDKDMLAKTRASRPETTA